MAASRRLLRGCFEEITLKRLFRQGCLEEITRGRFEDATFSPWPYKRPQEPQGEGAEYGIEGAAKTAPKKNPETLNKKRRGQEKDNKQTPQI